MDNFAVENLARQTGRGQPRWRPVYSTLLVSALTFCAGTAQAAPQGGEIVAGRGNIGRAGNDVTVISQQSHRLGINWDSFNVAANESVVFQQPGSSSIALNRIFDQNPSQILGAIDANGQVFLINPSGIVFGESATVNLHSIVASSLDISTDDFMSGKYDLKALSDRAGGLVVNRGLIQAATGGSVTLVGGAVANEGLIVADYGQVNLAAGKRATLDFDGDRLMLFEVSEKLLESAAGDAAAVSNSGTIQADGGQVLLSGSAASDVVGSVVNNSGVIRAGRIENVGGVVRLVADGGTVLNSGDIDVSGTQDGGRIELLGDRVGVFNGARVNADGESGGGTVLIGGGLKGADPDVMNADGTFIGADTRISADALGNGDGGTIIAWSDEVTRVYGELSARGGAQSGDGGFIETSSKEYLDIRRTPDVTAPNGDAGAWLIDPNNIAIVAGNGCLEITGCPAPAGPDFTTEDDGAEIGVDLIQAALAGGADVTITTGTAGDDMDPGDITWGAGVALDYEGGDGGSLTLTAANDIMFDGSIADSGGGVMAMENNESIDVAFFAGGSVTINGTISLLDGTLTVGDMANPVGDVMDDVSFTLGATGVFNGSGLTVFANRALILQGSVDMSGADPLLDTFANLNSGVSGMGSVNTLGFMMFDGVEMGNVTGGAGPDQFTISQDLSVSVNGGGNVDRFILAGGSLLNGAAIDGGLGIDVLQADNTSNTWTITGPNAGTLTGVDGNFSGIEVALGGTMDDDFTISGVWQFNINAGAGADSFTMMPGGGVMGALDGGTDMPTNNSIDTLTGANMMNMWQLLATNSTLTGVSKFNGIENIVGGTMVDQVTVSTAWAGDVSLDDGADSVTFMPNGRVTGTLDGGSDLSSDSITAANTDNTWMLNDPRGGSLALTGGATTANFSNFEVAIGGSLRDIMTISAVWASNINTGAGNDVISVTGTGGVMGALDGGGGNEDRLVGPNASNTWELRPANSVLMGVVPQFNNIENIVGGTLDDMVTVFDVWTGDVSLVNGADSVTFMPNGRVTGTLDGGSDGSSDSITGANITNTWMLTGPLAGTLDRTGDTRRATFSNFEVVIGGTDVDLITVDAIWTSNINAGDGNDVITLTTSGGIMGALDGAGGTEDELIAANASNVWELRAVNSTVTGVAQFNGIEDIVGGDMDDNVTVFDPWTGTIRGGDGTDSFTLMGGTVTGTIDGEGGVNTLTADNVPNMWTLTGAQTGSVTGVNTLGVGDGFANISNLVGGTMQDQFVFAPGASIDGSIDGVDGMGDDTIDWTTYGLPISLIVSGAGSSDGFAGAENDLMPAPTGSITGSFDNIDVLLNPGLGDSFTYTGADATNTWTLTGASDFTLDNATLGPVAWTGFLNVSGGGNVDNFTISAPWGGDVSGGDGNDTFTLDSGSVIGRIRGEGGADTLTANNEMNAWVLTAEEGGNVTSVSGFTRFVGINTIVGGSTEDTVDLQDEWGGDVALGAGNDTVHFAPDSGVLGTIDGGADTDTLDWSAYGAAIAIMLDSDNNGDDAGSLNGIEGVETVTGATFDNINAAVGSGLGDALTAANRDNIWDLNGAASFDLNGTQWDGFASVTGGTDEDHFTVSADFNGVVNGGDGSDDFTLTDGFTVGAINGDEGDDRLIAGNGMNNWSVTMLNTGTVTGITGMFTGMENLQGGIGDDIVTLTTGTITGEFVGGMGNNMLTAANVDNDWVLSGPDSGSVTGIGTTFSGFNNLAGGSMADDFVLTGAFNGTIDGGAGAGVNTLTAANTINTWSIAGAMNGSVTGPTAPSTTTFSNINNVTGGTAMDTFGISGMWAGDVSGGDGTDFFNYSLVGEVAGNLSGDAGEDTVDFSMVMGSARDVVLRDGNIFAVESFVGNGGTFIGAGIVNTWLLNQMSGGTVTNNVVGIDVTVNFSGFGAIMAGGSGDSITVANGNTFNGAITGGVGNDVVIFENGSSVTGLVDGAAGLDTLDWSQFAGRNVVLQGARGPNGQAGSEAASAPGGFANIDTFITSGMNDSLEAADIDNTWMLNGADAFMLNNVQYTGFANLTGGDLADNFSISGGSLSGNLNGGAGANTLTGDNVESTWTITGASTGSTGAITGQFSNIGVVTGGNQRDVFNLESNFAGALRGGAGNDAFNLLGGTVFGELSGGIGTDSLTGTDAGSTWLLTGPGAGMVDNQAFGGFESAIGGSGMDTMTVTGDFGGTVDGGAGDDQLALEAAVTSVVFVGGAGNDTLSGGAANDAFVASTGSDGTLNDNRYSAIENLNGAAGNDALSATFTGLETRGLNFDGGAGTDTVTVTGGGDGVLAFYDAVTGTVRHEGGGNVQSVQVSNVETVFDRVAANSLTVSGTAGDDVFTLGTGTAENSGPVLVTLVGDIAIDADNKTDLLIGGLGGNDSVDVVSNVMLDGTLELEAETVTNTGGGTITASLLRLVNTGMAGVGNALQTMVDMLQITGGSGEANIAEVDDLMLAASDTTGNVNITAGGALGQTGALTVAGTSNFDAASIALGQPANDFGGAVSLDSDGNASITDQNGLTLGTTSVDGNLSATALAGNLDSSGAVTVAGTTLVSATAGNLALGNAANSFGGALTVAAANNATINSGSALTLGAANVMDAYNATSTNSIELQQLLQAGGNVTLTAVGGALSESGAGAISGRTLIARSTGGMSLTGNNRFTGLNARNNGGVMRIANTAGTLTVSGIEQMGSGLVDLDTTGGLTINGAVTSGAGGLQMNATQAIRQNGGINTNRGAIDVNAGTGLVMAANATTTSNGAVIDYCSVNGDMALALLDAGVGDVVVKSGSNLFSINGITATNIVGTNVSLSAEGAIGSQQESITIDAPPGNAGKITFLKTSASQVFVANKNNTQEFNATTATVIDFGAAAAIAAFQAGQSSSLQDVGFVDLALFSPDVTLINTVGAGVLMPCSQLDDEEARCQ